ncbi:hypothetical protein FB451DRAFT_1395100 [Mycena latifolia]|nr:hypothetical protein FB451DRAFT_1395100 [Mycena latifolia]
MLRLLADAHSNWTPRTAKEVDAVRALSMQLEIKISSPCDPGHAISLVDDHAVMSAALRRVQGLLSAFHRLPAKILGRIFEHFVMHRTELDSRGNALLLCSVSKRWRSVAFSTPSLWNSLELIVRPGWNPAFDSTCISRSFPLPLNIRLRYEDYFPPALEAALRLISRNLGRTRYLSLDLQQPWNGEFCARPAHVFPDPKDCTHASELVFLTISIPPNTVVWEWIFAVVGSAPKLTRFAFLGDVVLNAPWTQLVNLSLGSITLSEAFCVLDDAPHLQICAFILTSSPEQPQKRILVHSLKCLMLQCDETPGTDDATLFLAYMSLPCLISLAIVGARGIWRQCAVTGFLDRSACTLRRLNLVCTPISDREVFDLLCHPSIQKLSSLKLENSPTAVRWKLFRDVLLAAPRWYGPMIRSLRTIYLSPITWYGDVVTTLEARMDDDGRYALKLSPGIPDMSRTFTLEIPYSELREVEQTWPSRIEPLCPYYYTFDD